MQTNTIPNARVRRVLPFPGPDYQPTYSPLECVMEHEQSVAEALVFERFKEVCGKYPPHVAGYNILLQIYLRESEKEVEGPGGKKTTLVTRSNAAVKRDKYQSMTALVIGMGPSAFRGNNFDGTPRFPTGPWCRIGDWVIISSYAGPQFSYGDPARGVYNFLPLLIIPDDKIMCKVQSPDDVVATHIVDLEMS